MRTLEKRERIAVAAAIVAAAMLFFGDLVWGFAARAVGGEPDASSAMSADETPAKAANISTVEGLEIYDMEIGTGAEAVAGSTVTTHYVGTLASDGTQFDSSLERGPFTFKLGSGAVIRGWDIGIEGMKVGGVRQLVVSPEYGYGPQAIGPIPPNSTLIFHVQLLEVK